MKKFFKKYFGPIWRAWMLFARILGKINSTILLTLFYLSLMGFAWLVTALARKDLLDTRWNDRKSYWKRRENFKTDKESFLRPY